MASITSKKHGFFLRDTITPGRRIEIYLGLALNKTEQKKWIKAYEHTVLGLTPAQKATLAPTELRDIVTRVSMLDAPEQRKVASGGLMAPQVDIDLGAVTTWETLFNEFEEWEKANGKHLLDHARAYGTIQAYMAHARLRFWRDADAKAVAGFVAWRTHFRRSTDARSADREVSARQKRKELQAWRRCWSWAMNLREPPMPLGRDPFAHVEIKETAKNTETKTALTTTEIDSIFSALRDIGDWRLHDLLLLSYLTGSELSALQWIKDSHPDCIDKETRTIQIFTSQLSGLSGGKTSARGRKIPLTPTISKILERRYVLRGFRRVDSVMSNTLRKPERGYKFPVKFTPHQLRHSYATHHINAGMPLETVSRRLGHESIQITLDTYGRQAQPGIPRIEMSHKAHLKFYEDLYFREFPCLNEGRAE